MQSIPSSASRDASAPVIRAVIDIGTNSVKLLVAEVHNGNVRPRLEEAEQTRLGRGFFSTRYLQPEAIQSTARVVARFAATAAESNPERIRVIATSAARDALNQEEFIQAIQSAARLPLEIISGQQEAEWAFRGVATDSSLVHKPILIIDLGGGSSEFILGRNGSAQFCQSYPLGTVRLLEQFPPQDPPARDDWIVQANWVESFLINQVHPALNPMLDESSEPVQLVGTSGTTSIIARIHLALSDFNRERIESTLIPCGQIERQRRLLWSLPLEKRRAIPGLPPSRADVILAGIVIVEAIMRVFRFPTLRPSTRGLRFAALLNDPERMQTPAWPHNPL